MKKFTIAVTGHRPNKISNDLYDVNSALSVKHINRLKEYIIAQVKNHPGFDEYWMISGMALGIDTLWAIATLQLQNEGNDNIKLLSAIPCANHSSKWTGSSKRIYNAILGRADEIVNVSTQPYTHSCMQERNEYMVDNCDKLLAVWNGTKGGTGNCVAYALSQSKTIDKLEPYTS